MSTSNPTRPPSQESVFDATRTIQQLLKYFVSLRDSEVSVDVGAHTFREMAELVQAIRDNTLPAIEEFVRFNEHLLEMMEAFKPFSAKVATAPAATSLVQNTTTDATLHPAEKMLIELGLAPRLYPMYHLGDGAHRYIHEHAFTETRPDCVTMQLGTRLVKTVANAGLATVILYANSVGIKPLRLKEALGPRQSDAPIALFNRSQALLEALGLPYQPFLVRPSIMLHPGVRWFLDEAIANDNLRIAWEHAFKVMSTTPLNPHMYATWKPERSRQSTQQKNFAGASSKETYSNDRLFGSNYAKTLPEGMKLLPQHFAFSVSNSSIALILLDVLITHGYDSSDARLWASRLTQTSGQRKVNISEASKRAYLKLKQCYETLGIDPSQPLPGLTNLNIVWFLTSMVEGNEKTVDFWTRVFTFFEGQILTVNHFRPWNGVPAGMTPPITGQGDGSGFPEPSDDVIAWLQVIRELEDTTQSGVLVDYIKELEDLTGDTWTVSRINAAIAEAADITRWLVRHCIEDGDTANSFPTKASAGWNRIESCINEHTDKMDQKHDFWEKLLRFAVNRKMNTIDMLFDPSKSPPDIGFTLKKVTSVTTASPHGGHVLHVELEE